MKYNELKISSHKLPTRVGRGIAAGKGKTAGRGTKGQKSRTGSSRRPGFEGGQNPLIQRMPKLRGFRSFKPEVDTIYTGDLDGFGVNVDNFVLAEKGLIASPYTKVKLISKGDVAKKHIVSLQGASANALSQVQKAGGNFTVVPQIGRESKSKETTEQSK